MPFFILIGLGAAILIGLSKYKKTTPENTAPPSPSPIRSPYIPTSRRDFVLHWQDAANGLDFSTLTGNLNTTKNCLLSVAAFESGWAGFEAKGVYTHTNNLYSITKGSSWNGPTYKTKSGMEFRVYPTWAQSIQDFINLMNRPYYATAKVRLIKADGPSFFREMKRLGYDASDPQYAEHLIQTASAIDGLV